SYFVERLTSDLEAEALAYFHEIDRRGGMGEAIEQGYPQQAIAESAYRFQQSVEGRDKVVVGVNEVATPGDFRVGTLYIDETAGGRQLARLDDVRQRRDAGRVEASLDGLRRAAEGRENTMPHLIDAVRAYATVGEVCDALRAVWGEYVEEPIV